MVPGRDARRAPEPEHSHGVLGLRGLLERTVRQQHAGEHRRVGWETCLRAGLLATAATSVFVSGAADFCLGLPAPRLAVTLAETAAAIRPRVRVRGFSA